MMFSAGTERRDAMRTRHGRVSMLERGTGTPVRLRQGFCDTKSPQKEPTPGTQIHDDYLTVI
jgi:hypothetical protein